MKKIVFAMAAAAMLCGCSSYRWTSRVPERMRTVAVPVFENASMAAELGPVVTQFTRREFEREGTFKLRRTGDAAVEVQGRIVRADRHGITFERAYGMRASEYRYTVEAEVSIIDKTASKVLQDNRRYTAETTFFTQGDLLTGQRNAAERIAADLARQIVDDVTSYPYNRPDAPAAPAPEPAE